MNADPQPWFEDTRCFPILKKKLPGSYLLRDRLLSDLLLLLSFLRMLADLLLLLSFFRMLADLLLLLSFFRMLADLLLLLSFLRLLADLLLLLCFFFVLVDLLLLLLRASGLRSPIVITLSLCSTLKTGASGRQRVTFTTD